MIIKNIINAFNLIEKISFNLSMVSAAIMMVLISLDALARYALNKPITGTLEITEDYLMVALVFMALSYTHRQGAHVRVTLMLQFIHRRIKAPLEFFFNLAGLGFFILLTIAGWEVFVRAAETGEFSSSILRYPLAPAYLFIPLGSALLCVRMLLSLFDPFKNKKTV